MYYTSKEFNDMCRMRFLVQIAVSFDRVNIRIIVMLLTISTTIGLAFIVQGKIKNKIGKCLFFNLLISFYCNKYDYNIITSL